jgi:hypothetical protein
MRAEIIQEAFPDLEPSLIQELARRTSRMTREQIKQTVQHYLDTGEMPNSLYTAQECPVNPETGAVLERLFDPASLARQIEPFGFCARYYAYLGGAGGNPLIRFANKLSHGVDPAYHPLGTRFSNCSCAPIRLAGTVAQGGCQ